MSDPEEYNLIGETQAKRIRRSGNGWKLVATVFIVGIIMLIGGLVIRANLSNQTCRAVQQLRNDIILVLTQQRTDPTFLQAARATIGRPQCS